MDHVSLVSDEVYDALFNELCDLEEVYPQFASPDSPTQTVGSPVPASKQPPSAAATIGSTAIRHSSPMLSLNNTYNDDEVFAFDERVRKGLGIVRCVSLENGNFLNFSLEFLQKISLCREGTWSIPLSLSMMVLL